MRVPRVVASLAAAAAITAIPAPPVLTAVVPVGRAPCDAIAAFGGVWVTVDGTGTLVRIDPTRARVTRTIAVGSTACSVAASRAAFWVTRYRPSELVRIDRRSGVLRRVHLGRTPFDVLAASSIWTTWFDDGTLTRVDRRTLRLEQRVVVGGSPAGLALCAGRLWVGGGRSDTWLTAVDPGSNRAVRIDVGAESPAWPTCIGDSVWSPTAHGVIRLATQSLTVRATIGLPGTPARVAAGPDGTVWVTDKEESRIVRIDPTTDRVIDDFAAGPGAFAIARSGRSMWVTSYAGADIRRFESA